MKKLLPISLLAFAGAAFAAGPFIGTVQLNPPGTQTGAFNVQGGTVTQALNLSYLTGNQCLQVNSGVIGGSGALCSASSGGGQSTLGVNWNGVQVSSPTAQINFLSPIVASLKGSTTAQISVNCSSVTCEGQISPILNQNFLQGATTAYPNFLYVGSSATITGNFSANNLFGNGSNLTSLNASNITSGIIGLNYLPGGIIISTGTLQSGATVYVSSETIATQFNLPSQSGVLYDSVGIVQGGATTTNLPEGTNQYFTTVRATGSITATSPLSNTSGNISMAQAGASQSGWLSTADWITFNSKPSASGLILNQNTLQSGATAYPDFLYVGSTATITGQLKTASIKWADGTIQTSSPTATSVAGADSQVQLNQNGVFGSTAAFSWNQSNNKLLLTTTLSGDNFPVLEASGTIKLDCTDSGPIAGLGFLGLSCRNNTGELWSSGPALVYRVHSIIMEREDNSWQGGWASSGNAWDGDSLPYGITHQNFNPLSTRVVLGNMSIGANRTAETNGLSVAGKVIVTTTTTTGQMTVGSPTFGSTPALALIQGVGQSADLLDLYNSNNVLVGSVNNSGVFTGVGSSLTSLNGSNVTSGTIGTAYLPSGTQGIIFSTNSLQSGTTFYVSSGTAVNFQTTTLKFNDGTTQTTAAVAGGVTSVSGGLGITSTGGTTPVIHLQSGATMYVQNTGTLQSGATAYPDFLYVGSSATITTASIANLVSRLINSRLPGPLFNNTSSYTLEPTDGATGNVGVTFMNGNYVTMPSSGSATTFYSTGTWCADWGSSPRSGLTCGTALTNNSWLDWYAVDSTSTPKNSWTLVGSTIPNVPSNYAALNAILGGANNYVHLFTLKYGDGSLAPNALLQGRLTGNCFYFRNPMLATKLGANVIGVELGSGSGTGSTTITYTYASGMASGQIPPNITVGSFTGSLSAGGAVGTGIMYDSGQNFRYVEEDNASGSVILLATNLVDLTKGASWVAGGAAVSNNLDLILNSFCDDSRGAQMNQF